MISKVVGKRRQHEKGRAELFRPLANDMRGIIKGAANGQGLRREAEGQLWQTRRRTKALPPGTVANAEVLDLANLLDPPASHD